VTGFTVRLQAKLFILLQAQFISCFIKRQRIQISHCSFIVGQFPGISDSLGIRRCQQNEWQCKTKGGDARSLIQDYYSFPYQKVSNRYC
jgi:hypothetical protein